MAAMSTAMATVAAVPAAAGLRMESSLESSKRSSPSSVLMGQRKAAAHVPTRRGAVVVRASGSEQESQVWNVAKGAAAAAAIALVLSASPAQAAFPKFPDNPAGEAARNILEGAKTKADASFAEAQKTGKETTGQAASAGDADPAISQVNPNAEEASDPIGNSIASKADAAADLAPGTSQQAKKGVNAVEKAFATPTRGLGDKAGETEARAGNLFAKKDNLPGDDETYKQKTGVSEGIYNSFKAAGEGRDAGVGVRPQ